VNLKTVEPDTASEVSEDEEPAARNTVKKPVVRKPWTKDEKAAIFNHLSQFIKDGAIPRQQDCTSAIRLGHGALANRSWRQVKYAVKNLLSSSKNLRNK
jgi:hypothetical protein